MEKRILAKDLEKHVQKKVTIRGWLNNLRPFGKLTFLLLRDRSGLTQVIIEDKEEQKKVKHLQPGSILKIQGLVRKSDEDSSKTELADPKITVENEVTDVPPIDYYKPEIQSDLDFILDHRPISLRNQKLQAVFKVQAEIAHAYRLFMHDQMEATEYFPPNMLGASSEGGSEFFNVDYFDHTATLAQSSQLYKQIMVGVNEKVFAIAPFFRAEPSHTTRHLSEGKQLEFEMGFFSHWHEILDTLEACVKFIVSYLEKNAKDSLSILGDTLVKAPQNVSIPRLTFKEALELCFQRTGIDERNEPDLSPSMEKELCAWALEKHGTDFVFVTDWKTEKRPFYSFQSEDDPELTNTFDLLCAGTEITSGGQRRNSYQSMVDGLHLKGMKEEDFTDYLSIFKYGMPPHGGFGLGLERVTMTFLKLKNIREASLFPSDPKRIAGVRIKANIFFGGETIRNEIIRLCNKNELEYQHLKHEKTPTSEDSSNVRQTAIEEGVKAILVRGKKTKSNFQFNIPADKKLDMKAVSQAVGEKCEFEDPKIIEERFGLEIGGVPPFGNLIDIDNYFDLELQEKKRIAFNAGLSTESILMNSSDLQKITDPKWGHFSK